MPSHTDITQATVSMNMLIIDGGDWRLVLHGTDGPGWLASPICASPRGPKAVSLLLSAAGAGVGSGELRDGASSLSSSDDVSSLSVTRSGMLLSVSDS